MGMTDAMLNLFPDANVYHIGLFREKISLQPVECKLPIVSISHMLSLSQTIRNYPEYRLWISYTSWIL